MSIDMSIQTLASTPMVLSQVNPIVINLLVGAFLLISIVMILIVLIQRPQGGGLGGAFGAGGGGGSGGGGAGQTAFGTKTGDVLTGGTIAIFILFLTFAIILNFVTRPPEAPSAQPTASSPVTTEAPELGEAELIEDLQDSGIESEIQNGVDAVNDAVDDAAEQAEEPLDDPASVLPTTTEDDN